MQARGFVANSFFSGLTCTEFFLHCQANRVGLLDGNVLALHLNKLRVIYSELTTSFNYINYGDQIIYSE